MSARDPGGQASAGATRPGPPLATADVPLATYRLQLHRDFGFADAQRIVAYLHDLGISHLYSSPVLRARAGSLHGYDVVDHESLNPELGDEAGWRGLCAELARHGMGQILDVVPNHMGVLEADNAWWLDVLEHGPASPHAATFDIEWAPAAPEMHGRLLLPVLGDHYGRVLEAGEIRLAFDAAAGAFWLHYWDHRFPIDPATCVPVLQARCLPVQADASAAAGLASVCDGLLRLPLRAEGAPTRRVQAQALKQHLARYAAGQPWFAEWIAAALDVFNGSPGDAASFDALDALIARQAYRLAHWRVASDDVNYRRFFDVNGLAALRMEREPVFRATHARVLQWLAQGCLSGLRIDHPDGLADPQQYFERLQDTYAADALDRGRQPRALYLVVEKIQAEHESLPESWPVHGDSGYRFGALVNGLFVDAGQEGEFDRQFRVFSGETAGYEETVYRCKKLIIESALAADLGWLTEALHRLLRRDRRDADFTRNRLRAALTEVAAAFPVYRSYLRAGTAAGAADRQHLQWAIAAARRRLGPAEASLLDRLGALLADPPGGAPMARFLARWQQFTAPVMAKAVEDTAFYRYLRLPALNDVGAHPGRFGTSVAAFHAANQTRARFWPHALLATSTHDSKRSEDLRARLAVLSELPAAWSELLQRLSGWAEMYRTDTEAGRAPCRREIWLLFQTLVGIWPCVPPAADERARLRERVQAYMRKATREAKEHTSWVCPDEAYEAALARYVDAVLRDDAGAPFITELQAFVQRIAPFGFWNALSQLAIKLTAPGVPDLYQGCEQWNFSLVDPDNRRPVDFVRLQDDLRDLAQAYAGARWPTAERWQELRHCIADGRLKQLLTWRLLALRRSMPALFRDGAYLPVAVEGPAAEHLVGYLRSDRQHAVLVFATRLTHTLCAGDPDRWGPACWQTTRWSLPEQAAVAHRRWRHWLTGEVIEGDAAAAAASLFTSCAGLPVAVFTAA